MILLVGLADDSVLVDVMSCLTQKQQQFFFLDQKKIGHEFFLTSKGIEKQQTKKISYSDFSGVLNRSISIDFSQSLNRANYMQMPYLTYALDSLCHNVMNRPAAGRINFSKIYQLQFLKTHYLKIPDSWIFANTLASNMPVDCIYKSVSSTSSLVRLYEYQSAKKITCPVLFQHYIPGDNIRVHVVKDTVFPIKITSNAVDYRYASGSFTEELFDLPENIRTECIALTRQNGLVLCGIDLIKNEDGTYYLLEINPGPTYTDFLLSADITTAVVSALGADS